MNRLYFGDNLDVLSKHIPDECVDLVYLDPPFNSKAQYNVLYETPSNAKETAQRSIFRDSWWWEEEAQACFEHVLSRGGSAAAILSAFKGALGASDTMAYLAMMSARLIELRRVMKPTASLYLHCDPTASHYLKIILDSIFGPRSFRNEVIWKRTSAHSKARRWGPVHDTILFYTTDDEYTWNKVFQAYSDQYVATKYRYEDSRGKYRLSDLTAAGRRTGDSGQPWRGFDPTAIGRHWAVPGRALAELDAGVALTTQAKLELLDRNDFIYWTPGRGGKPGFPQIKRHLGEGHPIQDIVDDIAPVNSMAKERIGYPTQKPVPLLKRIIEASSNPGEVVLDPFCGCGTTIEAAARLNRQWIGIDVSYYGVRLIERRVRMNLGDDYPIEVKGIPADLASAEALASADKYGFQQWAVDELGCQIWNDGKKGSDRGIDGEMWFLRGPVEPGRLLVQVKAGKKATVSEVRDFLHVMDREKAQMGIFFSRAQSTADMRREAAEAGFFRIGSTTYPRLALVELGDWLDGRSPRLPTPLQLRVAQDRAPKPEKRRRRIDPKQREMAFVFEGAALAPGDGQVLNPSAIPPEMLASDDAQGGQPAFLNVAELGTNWT